ncbi:MAG: hypothetical protein Q9226_002464 [Calogaya cf. arnoldii]
MSASGKSSVTHVSATQLSERAKSLDPINELLGSQYPVLVKNAILRRIKQQLARLATPSKLPHTPTPPTLPSQGPQTIQLDPEDSLSDPWRRTLWYAFANFGRMGIEKAMYDRARYEAPSAYREKILADEKQGSHLITYLLGGLTDACNPSFTKGTLAYDTQRDSELEKFVKYCMKPRNAPSIYCMAPRNHNGKWLTPDQAQRLVDTCRQYLSRAPQADKLNKAIDIWPDISGSAPERILTSDHSKQMKRDWLYALEKYCCKNTDPTKRGVAWLKVPFKVGFAVDTENRLKQHLQNRKTTALFAIAQAVLRLPKNIQGFDFPQVMQLELFPLVEDDENYAQLGKIVGSLLLSSYEEFGGLNPTPAGTASLSKHMASRAPLIWDGQVQTLAKRNYVEKRKTLGRRRVELAEISQVNRDAATDNLALEALKLSDEKQLVDHFSRVDPLKAYADKEIGATTADDPPDHIREEVDEIRRKGKEKASSKLEELFDALDSVSPTTSEGPTITTQPERGLVSQVLIQEELEEETSDMEDLDATQLDAEGWHDESEWDLPEEGRIIKISATEATDDELRRLGERIRSLDDGMQKHFDAVRPEMVQEYRIEDCKASFDDCVAASKVAAEIAQEKQTAAEQDVDKMELELQAANNKTREAGERVGRRNDTIRKHVATIHENEVKFDKELGQKNDEITTLNSKLQEANEELKAVRRTVTVNEEEIQKLRSQLVQSSSNLDKERGDLADKNGEVERLRSQLDETASDLTREREIVTGKDDILVARERELEVIRGGRDAANERLAKLTGVFK